MPRPYARGTAPCHTEETSRPVPRSTHAARRHCPPRRSHRPRTRDRPPVPVAVCAVHRSAQCARRTAEGRRPGRRRRGRQAAPPADRVGVGRQPAGVAKLRRPHAADGGRGSPPPRAGTGARGRPAGHAVGNGRAARGRRCGRRRRRRGPRAGRLTRDARHARAHRRVVRGGRDAAARCPAPQTSGGCHKTWSRQDCRP